MTNHNQKIAIYGGAFDPVHLGHLNTALFLQDKLNFDDFFFLPCKTPLLKEPATAQTKHRINMLSLAIKDYPQFVIDKRELERDTPSYMTDTLVSYRKDYPLASLNLILGIDAFAKLQQWHEWQKLLTLANLIVINRADYDQSCLPTELKQLLAKHEVSNPDSLEQEKSGLIFQINAGDYSISSSQIRSSIKQQLPFDLYLPSDVTRYIKQNHLYL